MADLPYMQFYVDDFEGATAHLTLEEDGAYNRLLRLCWRQPDCSIPNDEAWLARMLRCDMATFERVVAPLLKEFFCEQRGRLFQKRQREEFLKGKELVNKRKEAGRKGGKSKRLNTKENTESNTSNVLEAKSEQNTSQAEASRTRTRSRTISSSGEDDGAPAAPPPQFDFSDWENALFAVEGVKGSGLEISPYAAMVALKREGFDLHSEVIPVVKADIARARVQNRLNRLSWSTIAGRVTEERQKAGNRTSALKTAEPTESEWFGRMHVARRMRQWDAKWGPYPNQPGCLVPAALVLPDDGKGWTDWKPQGATT
jgi:uncharacterized protein YdaU (DUF1376 family)